MDLNQKSDIDMINFERRQREFLNELAMKRMQVDELKKELDEANLKIQKLTRTLEAAKRTSEEHEYNLNLAVKNARFFEDKLQANQTSAIKTKLQQESAVDERENLREMLQKSEMHNYNLHHELNELKSQHSCDVAYQRELMGQDAKIRTKLAHVTEAVQRYQVEHNAIMLLSSKVETAEKMQSKLCFYQEEMFKLKQDFVELEKKYIVAQSALDKFEQLSSHNNKQFTDSPEIKIIIQQWLNATAWFNGQTEIQQNTIDNLTKALEIEKQNNIKICLLEAESEKANQELRREIEKLQTKLNPSKEDKGIQIEFIKSEVIEIVDK